jgi:hypothetical protein
MAVMNVGTPCTAGSHMPVRRAGLTLRRGNRLPKLAFTAY